MPRLAVTRTSEQLVDLSRRAAERGIEIVPLPVVVTRPIAFEWPRLLNAGSISWALFSSSNAVHAFFDRVNALGITLPASVRFGAIGDRTAAALKSTGKSVAFMPSDAYGQLLFDEFLDSQRPEGQIVYARAREINFDPQELFARQNVAYWPIVCYETISHPVDPHIVHSLSADDYILFTAPSAVRAFQEQFGKPLAKPIAIGRTTGSEMSHHGWVGVHWMNKPVIENVLEYL
jgi:uroporphyrinogen-III synthase